MKKTDRQHSSATQVAPDAPARPRIGAQIKSAGGFALVPDRAFEIGAEVVQIFNANARQWRPRPYDPVEIKALTSGLRKYGLPLFFHTIYLINLASPDDELRRKSAEALAEALFAGAVCGAAGIVTHVGSRRGEDFTTAAEWVRESVLDAFAQATARLTSLSLNQSPPLLLLETSAGSANSMGRDLDQLSVMLESLPGLCGLCLDTAHLFAAGYPLQQLEGANRLVATLETMGLLPHVKLIHLNDSKAPFASGRDHHENLGQGEIGATGLSAVVSHPAFCDIPFVLEVPGLDGHGPDAANIATAKSWITA